MTFAPWTLYWPASEGGSLNRLLVTPDDNVVPPNRGGVSLDLSVRVGEDGGTTVIDSSARTRQGTASSIIAIKPSCMDVKPFFMLTSYSKKLAIN